MSAQAPVWRANQFLGATPVEDRFWSKVDKEGPNGCWIWRGTRTAGGWGRFHVTHSRMVQAHRFAYELLVGSIPAGLTLDHLCRNRACVNPSHLEPISRGENTLRAEGLPAENLRKTHCPRGHAYSPENTYQNPRTGRRHCRTCRREWDRKHKRNA